MTQFQTGGSADAERFEWSGIYDDAAHTVVLEATGTGRCTVVIAQANGQRARVNFTQPSVANGAALPLPSTIPQNTIAVTVPVPIGAGPVTITGATLRPFPSAKPGGVGYFETLSAAWSGI
jgi:hypothetical protein